MEHEKEKRFQVQFFLYFLIFRSLSRQFCSSSSQVEASHWLLRNFPIRPIRKLEKAVYGANTQKKINHTMCKGMTNYAQKVPVFLSCLGLWKDVYCKLVFLWLKRVCCCFCTKKGENVKMNYVFGMIRWLDIHLSQKFDRPLSSRNYFFPYQRVFYFTIPAVWGQIRSKITHVTPDILTVKKVMVSLYFRPSFESVTHNGYILW